MANVQVNGEFAIIIIYPFV